MQGDVIGGQKMRIINVEKFRNELYEAIEDTCAWRVDTSSEIVDDKSHIISLAHPMKIEGGALYLTVDEDAVCFWRSENGRFKFDGYIDFKLYKNKFSFIAALVLRIANKIEK